MKLEHPDHVKTNYVCTDKKDLPIKINKIKRSHSKT